MENCCSFVANILQWICGRHGSMENHGETSITLNITACEVQPNLKIQDSFQDSRIENNFQNYCLEAETLQGLSSAGHALNCTYDGDSNMEHQRDFYVCPSTSILDERSFQNFQSLKKYDVFINHRGPDVKLSFVSHLNEAFISVGLNPFLDAKSLVKGHHAFHSINEALNGVGVHVAIFSKRYAESKYCLNELCDMLKSGKPIIPVYFDIDPTHLRQPHDGPFANAFIKHRTRGREGEIVRWKEALKKVANITGFLLTEVNGDEAKLKKRIVNAVLAILSPSKCVQIPRHRVALEESVKEVVERMDMIENDVVKVVGIVGMGGIGKTTLAAEVYNHFVKHRERFQYQCFLKDVKDNSTLDMQRQMVQDVFQKDLKNNEEYISCWFDRLCSQRVLVIIDDINHRSQFDSLIPQIKTLGSGSRVLVTSRDWNLLNNITQGQSGNTLYEVKELNFIDSSRLFNWHAFCGEEPSDGFHDLAKEVVQACSGLPLALEVIGAFLYDKKTPNDFIYWHQASRGLGMNVDISMKLKISYDSLNCQEQEMFLDISCFLVGKEEDFALKIWENCDSFMSPQLSLRVLRDKSLIKIDGPKHKISMHDVLRDMGRDVVTRQSHVVGERSHLWNPETSWSVVEANQGSNRIQGLCLNGGQPPKTMATNKFAMMCGLRFLILQACEVEGDFSTWPKSLKWLKWSENSKLLELPSTLHLFNLAVLDLSCTQHLSKLWLTKSGNQVPCPQLRILLLNVCSKLKELPQDLGSLSRLQTLEMTSCRDIKTLPDSIGNLKELENLSLRNCDSLEGLPESIGQLRNLKVINLAVCYMLRELPELFGNLQGLVKLDVSWSGLSKLPMTFLQLTNLEEISLEHCSKLHELPTTMKHFPKLKIFNAWNTCTQNLPKDFEQLHNLNVLKLDAIDVVPTLMTQNSNLKVCDTVEVLELRNCRAHPSNIHGFKGLKTLTLDNSSLGDFLGVDQHHLQLIHTNSNYDGNNVSSSKSLNTVTKLPNFETLRLTECTYVTCLPSSITGLLNLRSLTLRNCPLQCLPNDFGLLQNSNKLYSDLGVDLHEPTVSKLVESFLELANLEQLTLGNCKDLKELPSSIIGLHGLNKLALHGCPLQALPNDFGLLHALKYLHIDLGVDLHQPTISKLPNSFLELSNLEHLALKNCKDLKELPSPMIRLHRLSRLIVHGCPLEDLPNDFGLLHNLNELDIDMGVNHHNSTISTLPESFSKLSNLKYLTLKNCKKIRELPSSMIGLHRLQRLTLHGCPLEALPNDFGLLNGLKYLDIDLGVNHHNSTISTLPESFSKLSNLKYLTLKNCKDLRELPSSMIGLHRLQRLTLHGCPLEALPNDFGLLHNLNKLDIDVGVNHHNSTISTLPESFSKLSNLKYLTLKNCKDLRELPSSMIGLQRLSQLIVDGCPLEALPNDFGLLHNLNELDIDVGVNHHNSTISTLPESFSKLSNLKYLTLKNCKDLRELPSSMIGLQRLSQLIVDGCPLEALPNDFGLLHNLNELDIDVGVNHHNSTISTLPESFSKLSNLKYLTLKNCKDLRELPSSMIGLQRLSELIVHGCPLEALPNDFGLLHNLNKLDIDVGVNHHNSTISTLPESFSKLSNLKYLTLKNCKDLRELPSSMIGLHRLQRLTLHGCPLEALPNDFGLLHNLNELDIDMGVNHHNSTISTLPESFSKLSNLKYLTLRNCKDLRELPSSMIGLHRLQRLTLHGCPLEALPNDFGLLHNLNELDIDVGVNHYNSTISTLPESFLKLSNLEYLTLKNCKKMRELPSSMIGLSRLQRLTLHGCPLEALPNDFGLLHNLNELYIDLGVNIPTIFEFPDSFSKFSNLQSLTLKGFKDLQEFPSSMSGLVMLHYFEISSTMIKSLPSYIKHCTKLKTLRLIKNQLLQKLPECLSSLKQLKDLQLVGNCDLSELPNGFGELEALITLDLGGCYLKDIARRDLKFGLLTSLTWLNLEYNPIMISPKVLENLGSLQYLNMSHCRNLTTIEGLPITLEVLELGGCCKLEFIPSIATLKKLRFLSLRNCEALKHVCGLESLKALKQLNLSGCSTLQCSSVLCSNVVLERCYLSGSNVFISYDNDWKKVKPSQQIISYYDTCFPSSNMSSTQTPMHVECGTTCCMDVIIASEEECLAIIFFIIAHDQGWSKHVDNHGCYNSRCSVEAQLIRNNVQIESHELFKLRHADNKDQVYICTLRRGNSLVCNLKCGDKICLFATSKYLGWTVMVKEAMVCVMHTCKGEVGEVQGRMKRGGHVGSSSKPMSQETMNMFSTLVLGDSLEKEDNVTLQSIEDSSKSSCVTIEVDSINKSNPIWEPRAHNCDGCFMRIENQRWHCEECADFDLCGPCHNGANSNRLPRSHKVDHRMEQYIGHDVE